MKPISLISLFLIFLSVGSIKSQALFKDIYTGTNNSGAAHLTPFTSQGVFLFMASNGTNGVELWKSDGTAPGTSQIKDIYAGSNPSYPLIYHEYNGNTYFRANNNFNGYELWKTDLTSGGTQLVKDAWPGSSSGVSLLTNGFQVAEAGGNMVMPLSNGTTANGLELWKSDGTAAGTIMIKDIYPGVGSSSPKDFVQASNFVFFTAYDYDLTLMTGTARELWRTNGTTAGTAIIKDINPGLGSSTPQELTRLGGNAIIFSADNGINGRELWVSNGTTAGTQMLKDIHPTGSSDPEGFQQVGSEVFFFADDGVHGFELWKTDGTPAGTVMVKDINSGAGDSKYIIVYKTEMNGAFYFNATDGVNGNELWRSNGTAAGTQIVADIRTGSLGSNPSGFFAHNGILYVSAYDAVDGFELWASDGTNTYKVMSIYAGTACGCPGDFIEFGSTLYFTATHPSYGREIWSMTPLSGPLPVSQLTFEAKPRPDGTIDLFWETESETNNAWFEVERSGEGNRFSPIKTIEGKGTTTSASAYHFHDLHPLPGRNVYRLKQVDFNGEAHYSSLAVVILEGKTGFEIAPNPVEEIFRMHLQDPRQPATVHFFDMKGRELLVAEIPAGENYWEMSMADFAPGVYLCKVRQGDWGAEKKFVKR